MSAKANVHEAKTQFSSLLAQVEKGKEIINCKSGKPVACLHAIEEKVVDRIPGNAKGKVIMVENFDAPASQSILNAT